MTTALDLVNSAVQELGIYGAGETVSGDDVALCLSALNDLIDAWRLENLYVYAQQDIVYSLPANTASATIGLTADIDVERPVRFELGSFVRVGEIDYPLDVISQPEFNEIATKTLNGPWPRVCVYDAAFPIGTLTFYPQGACELHLNVQVPLAQIPVAATALLLPPGYKRALILSLTEEIAPKFQKEVTATTARKAMNARRVLKRSNLVVPQLSIGAESHLPGCYAILGG